jgi:hypothetical protein
LKWLLIVQLCPLHPITKFDFIVLLKFSFYLFHSWICFRFRVNLRSQNN